MKYQYETEEAVQKAFWRDMEPMNAVFIKAHINWRHGATQNQLPTDVRCAFVDWLDAQCKGGKISQELASEVKL